MKEFQNWQNRKTFEALFKKYYDELCSYAYTFLKDMDAGEEIVQDTFVWLWNKRDKIQIESSLRSYLYKAVKNASINNLNHLKVVHNYKKYNEELIASNEQMESDGAVAGELEQLINICINNLPPERKRIFLMSRDDEMKYKEIAEKLNISIKTVENQMGRALTYLRKRLAEFLTLLILIINTFFSGGKTF